MWIRACLIALVLLAALGRAGDCIGCYVRLAHSHSSLVALPQPEAPLSPVDRFILTLILARDDKADKQQKSAPGI